MKRFILLFSILIYTISCSGDDNGGTYDCLVCDKAYLKTYENGKLVSTQKLTWEENLVILGLDGFCVGTDLYGETTINKAMLEVYKVQYENEGSNCYFN